MHNKVISAIIVLSAFSLGLSGCSAKVENTSSDSGESITKNTVATSTQTEENGNRLCGGFVLQNSSDIYYLGKDKCINFKSAADNHTEKISSIENNTTRLQLQMADNKLFYLIGNNDTFKTSFLYCLDLDTKEEKQLFDMPVCSFSVYEEKLYLSTYDPEKLAGAETDKFTQALYSADLDGSNLSELYRTDKPMFVQINSQRIYLDFDEMLVSLDLNGGDEKIYNINHYSALVDGDTVYYIASNLTLRKFDLQTQDSSLIIDSEILSFNIQDDSIFYTNDKDELFKSDLDGNNSELLFSGSNPVICGDSLYYCDSAGQISNTII